MRKANRPGKKREGFGDRRKRRGTLGSGDLDRIVMAEQLGIDVVWLPSIAASPDPLAVFAVAATQTKHVRFGTSVIPTFPRHPLALAQTAKVVAALAPGRLRLGVGPSHKPIMESQLGIPFHKPQAHLREYVQILKAALAQGGKVTFEGEFFHVAAETGAAANAQVMISALRAKAFRLAGEMADGGISWVCPLAHIERVALPALREGAASAARPKPAMVMHVPIVVHDNPAEARDAAMKGLAVFPRMPYYSTMFVEAGFPEAERGEMSERMVGAIFVSGDEATAANRLRQIAGAGADEVLCTIIPAGEDLEASRLRTLKCLSELATRD